MDGPIHVRGLPPPPLALPPRLRPSVPCTEVEPARSACLSSSSSASLSVHEELAQARTALRQAVEYNELLAGALEEQRAHGQQQQEKIATLTRLNRDFRREIANLQSQVWTSITSNLTRTPPPPRSGPSPPQQQQQLVAPHHLHPPPSHHYQQQHQQQHQHHRARSGAGSPPDGEGARGREARVVFVSM